MRQDEFQMQRTLVEWARWQANTHPELAWLHASLNGVHLSKAQAGKAKAAGMVKGVADLFLPYIILGNDDDNESDSFGLFLELKLPRNKQTAEQIAFARYIRGQGYDYVIIRSVDEGIAALCEYLGITDLPR